MKNEHIYENGNGAQEHRAFPLPKCGADFAGEELDDNEDFSKEPNNHGMGGNTQNESQPRGARSTTAAPDTPFLDKFGKDLTREASNGKLDPMVGRER
mgnify:CR=1 FL=1